MYTLEEQIADAEKDLKDDLNTLNFAEIELEGAIKWIDKVKSWIEEDRKKLSRLRQELPPEIINEITETI